MVLLPFISSYVLFLGYYSFKAPFSIELPFVVLFPDAPCTSTHHCARAIIDVTRDATLGSTESTIQPRRAFISDAVRIGMAPVVLPWCPLSPNISQVRAEETTNLAIVDFHSKTPTVTSTPTNASKTTSARAISYPRLTSTKQIARYIYNSCNVKFLSSVVLSGYNFLYRGLSPEESRAVSSISISPPTLNDKNNSRSRIAAIIINNEPH